MSEMGRIGMRTQVNVVELTFWALAGALLSLLITGFVMGAGNNLFHMPIAAALFDEPQYRDDAFMQSLRFFASGVWLSLRGVEKYVDLYWLFLGLNVVSRFLTFLGFLLCAGLLGIRSRIDVGLFTLLLSACSLMNGSSYAGGGGMFPKQFSHSEIANGLTLIALYVIARGGIAASFALNGAVFFVNAFVAVWNAVPFAFVIANGLLRRKLRLSRTAAEVVIGLAVFLLIATPVIFNMLSNPDFGRQLEYDYVEFLRGYYPNHFLAGSTPLHHFAAATLVVLLGLISFWILGKPARLFALMLLGYVTVYLIGVAVPQFTTSATVINLHLLRVSTFFHLLAALGVVAVITKWLQSDDVIRARLLAPALIVVTCTARHGALLAPFILLASFETRWLQPLAAKVIARVTYSRGLLLAVAVVGLGFTVNQAWRENRTLTGWISEWTTIGQWARSTTPLTAMFMVPVVDIIADGRNGSTLAEAVEVGSATFELTSHRRVWVDFRRGAAVMWSGSYQNEWRSRVDQQVKLATHQERMDYARRNGITHVVDLCAGSPEPQAAFRTARLCVFVAG